MYKDMIDLLDLLPQVICMAEEGDGEGDPDDNPDEQEQQQEQQEDKSGEDVSGLKSALQKEREANRAKDKQLKAFQKAQADAEKAKMDDVDRLTAERDGSVEKAAKLATAWRDRSIRDAILDEARKLNFIDPSDALNIDRSVISYEQDDDDPSDVDIDLKTVTAAVKKLATEKKHLIRTGTDDGHPSGSGFGGSGKRTQKEKDEELLERYPSLRG